MPNPFGDVSLPGGFSIAVNNAGFGAYVGFPGIGTPIPPFTFIGTITYRWGATAPKLIPGADGTLSMERFAQGRPPVGGGPPWRPRRGGDTPRCRPGAPNASVVVQGTGGAPQVVP